MDNRTEIAKKAGLSRQTVSAILNKTQKNPKMKSLIKLSRVLNCTIDELLKEET